jgi:hypothetical protein
LRVLVPGCTGFNVQRTDDKTLVIRSQGPDIFSCDDVGPLNGAYVFSTCNLLLCVPDCKKGDRYEVGGLTAEVMEEDAANLPSCVSFRFDTSLDSPTFYWLWWNWREFSAQSFRIPAIGQSVTISGPAR